MKCRYVPTRKELVRTAEMVNDTIFEALRLETLANLVAAARYFGLGKKRMSEYVKCMCEVRNEFLEHQHDGVLREKLEEELNPLGVYYDDLFGDITSFKETMYAQRMLMNHKPASPKVARELTEQLDVMKQFQEEQIKKMR